MPTTTTNSVHAARALALVLCAGLCMPLAAQPPADLPPPAAQPPAMPAAPAAQPHGDITNSGATDLAKTDPMGRRPMASNDAVLAFPEATVKQIIPFIVESTGKVVIPSQTVLPLRISIVNDKPIPRQKALDLVFFALQQAGVAVIENADFIILTEAANNPGNVPLPVLGPEISTLTRYDLGSVVKKIFRLQHASAANVAEIVKGSLPDKTPIIADNDSAQVIITAPIALLQSVENIINALDKPPADLPNNETFHLKYADADVIAQNIRDLFADVSTRGTRNNTNQQQQQGGGNRQPGQGGQRGPGGQGGQGNPAAMLLGITNSGTAQSATPSSSILRVTSNQTLKTVTVVAETTILERVRKLIADEWDKKLPDTGETTRVYDLRYIDPVRLKAILEGTYGTGAATGGGNRSTTNPLSGQFTFQAIPEAHRLLVSSKIPGLIDANIDQLIAGLDRALTTGLPEIIELKHVQAEDLAEQLNALLAQEGTYAQVARVNTELSAGTGGGASPFSSETTSNENGFSQTSSSIQYLQLWWQRARPPTDNSGASNLIAKVRIVPIAKRNSLLVLATPEYQDAVRRLIEQLDKPGRQVLIAAVIAEISAEDALELGLRFSNSAITTTKGDGAIGIGPSQGNTNTITGQQTNLIGDLFTTSVLNVGVNINAVLQALNEKSKVTVLSEPRIFTGDNVEADFFDGQDIPFITQNQAATQTTALVQNFDYRAVGINLRVRPRITPERNVDVKVNLELSSIEPNQTLFGGFIVDRRQTTTQLIVGDGQTVVISGIMRSTDSDIRRKIPFLGDLPGIGELFKSTDRIKKNTELIAFITPIVVNGQEDSDKLNTDPRSRLGELRHELGNAPATPKTTPAPLTPAPGPDAN